MAETIDSISWRHKLLHAFVKNASTEDITAHVKALLEDVEEARLLLESPIPDATEQLLREVKKDCNLILLCTTSAPSKNVEPVPNAHPTSNVRLPKLNINSFDGAELEWLSWWDSYASSIHDNKELTDSVRVQYLATSLTGAARESTKQFPFVASSYQTIIRYLQTTYGDMVKLRSIYSNAITQMPQDMTVDGMRKNLDNLVAYLTHLEKFDPTQTLEHYQGHVISKFTENVIDLAYTLLSMKGEEQTLKNVLKALDCIMKNKEKAQSLKRTLTPNTLAPVENRQDVVLLTPTSANATLKRKRRECLFCQQPHSSRNCLQVTSSDKRRQILKDKNLCWLCLSPGHSKLECTQQPRGCSYCKKDDHNVALCYYFCKTLTPAKNAPARSTPPFKKQTKGKGIFLQTFVCQIFHNQEYHALRGVLDSCAHRSFINFDVLQKFKLSGQRVDSAICSFASVVPQTFSSQKIIIRLFNKKKQFHVFEFCSTPTIAPSFESAPNPDVCRKVLPYNLDYADDFLFQYFRPDIDLLIGNDFYNLVVRSQNTKVINDNLILLDTFFGYIPSGNLGGEPSSSSAILLSTKPKSVIKVDENVNFDNISNMYSLESLGINSSEVDATDELILQEYRSKKAYSDDNRLIVSWPWKMSNPKLNSNYRIALARLRALFVSESKDTLLGVDKIFKEQIASNILEIAPKTSTYLKHYLPHRPLKQKGKIRIVNDASAHVKSMPSLNDLLHKGPSLIKDVIGLILRFRWKRIAISSDIEKAFHQLVLSEEDRDVVRILWVKDINLPPKDDNIVVYRYARVPFGVNSSPFLLNIAIQDLFATPPVSSIDTLAALSFYVDNCLCSFESIVEARSFYERVMQRMTSVKFNLRDWISNDKPFYLSIPEELRAKFDDTSVLGIRWSPATDKVSLKFELKELSSWTKASVLSIIASVFDPLGWITPCLLNVKVFMQRTWSLNPTIYNWSTILPQPMQNEWLCLFQELKQLEKFSMPRFLWCFNETNECSYELHIFADASKDAYSCVAYVVKRSATSVESSLIFSKLKLTPKKTNRSKELSIPRLELMGVYLATKVKTFLMSQLKIFGSAFKNIVIWTDSSTILQWLSSPKVQCIFVQNRLVEIRKHKDAEFRHVRTAHNPADIPTRGLAYKNLVKSNLWWKGPEWLIDHSQWPDPPINVPNFVPKNCDIVFLTLDVPKADSLISDALEKRFNSWYKYVRTFQHVISYCLMSCYGKISTLSASEQYQRAERFIFLELQHKYFSKELDELRHNCQPNHKLQYFIHTDGLIRCKGRFNTSPVLSFERNNPILLPKCHLVKVFINHIHLKNLHSGPEHTLTKIREKFWIIGARPIVKSVIHKCVVCRRWEGGSYVLPPMPPLPSVRTAEVAPFIHTAVDLFGPLFYLNDKGEAEKCWVCIFVCLVTRAIHMELVRDMSGNEFLLAPSRFTSRRGLPKFILSDNGANFRFVQPLVGPRNSVRISHFKLDQYLSSNSIQWSFIPALAPWFGGAYERLIRIIKLCLKKSFGFIMLTMIELQTVLCQAEDMMNSRPLSYVSSDVIQPLTPNNFLRLRDVNIDTNLAVTVERVPITSRHLLAGWKKVNTAVEHYWLQFRSLYLQNLRQFHTPTHKKEKGSVARLPLLNEIVLLREQSAPRGEWQIGKVVKIDKNQATASVLLPIRHPDYLTQPSSSRAKPPRTILERSIRLLHPLELTPVES